MKPVVIQFYAVPGHNDGPLDEIVQTSLTRKWRPAEGVTQLRQLVLASSRRRILLLTPQIAKHVDEVSLNALSGLLGGIRPSTYVLVKNHSEDYDDLRDAHLFGGHHDRDTEDFLWMLVGNIDALLPRYPHLAIALAPWSFVGR